jgi:hypothetical protein
MQCIAFDSHKHYTWALIQVARDRLQEGSSWHMNLLGTSQRNRKLRHVPAGHAVIRHTPPG